MQRRDQTARRRKRFHIDQPARGLDQQFHFDRRARAPAASLNPAAICVTSATVSALGMMKASSRSMPPSRLISSCIEETVDGIEPHRDGLRAPILLGKRRFGGGQRSSLLGRRHRVFEVHEHGIGGRSGRVLHQPRAMRRHRQIGAGQSRCGHVRSAFRQTEFGQDRVGVLAQRRNVAHDRRDPGNGDRRAGSWSAVHSAIPPSGRDRAHGVADVRGKSSTVFMCALAIAARSRRCSTCSAE